MKRLFYPWRLVQLVFIRRAKISLQCSKRILSHDISHMFFSFFLVFFFNISSSIYKFFFFWIRGNLTPWKAHFVGPGEGVKPRLSQAFIRDACPDSNSRPTVQISNPLPSRYAPWGLYLQVDNTAHTSLFSEKKKKNTYFIILFFYMFLTLPNKIKY